jgi:hypothetical protein
VALSTGVWHLLAVTYDGTTMRFYVDGVLQAGSFSPGGGLAIPAGAGAHWFTIAGSASATPTTISARIDEVSVYLSALSAARLLAHFNAFNAGTGMGTTTNALTVASGARVAFGSPNWSALNTWQVRWRWISGGTSLFYPHYIDANNWLRVTVGQGTMTLIHKVAGVSTTLARASPQLASNVWYWLQITQFPAPATSGGGGTLDPACVQAVLLNDGSTPGTIGAVVATVGPVATQDAVTALAGRPQLEAVAQPLIIGGPYSSVHSVSLFGPGGWTFQGNGGAGACSGAWELDTTKTYPNGPQVSYGAARVDLPPAGAVDASWRLYTGGSPVGVLSAMPVAVAGDTLGFRIRFASTGLSGSASVKAFIREYDASGALLRTGAAQSGGNTAGAWATLQNLAYVTGANCAYVDLALEVVDAMAGASANGTVWFDDAQVWDVTKSGQADMPYCELRFPQSPAQLLLSGLVGDLPAPAPLAFGTYLASFAPGSALSVAIGRSGLFSRTAQLVGHVHGFYGAALTPTAIAVLDATSYGGYYAQALVQASWNPRAFSFRASDLRGIFHLLGRFLSKQTLPNLANVQQRAVAAQQSDPWVQQGGSERHPGGVLRAVRVAFWREQCLDGGRRRPDRRAALQSRRHERSGGHLLRAARAVERLDRWGRERAIGLGAAAAGGWVAGDGRREQSEQCALHAGDELAVGLLRRAAGESGGDGRWAGVDL